MFKSQLVRRFAASLAIVSIVSLTASQALAAGFPDTAGTNYNTAFSYLQDQGIIQGYADGLGRPGYPLNRVEALKVVLRASGDYDKRITFYEKKMPPIALFADVLQKEWYGPYVETAFENGVVTGYPDGTFRPGNLLRTEEAITMLMRTFAEQGSSDKAELSTYIENNPNQWYTPSINAAINRNLIMHTGKMQLGAAMTRGQFFDMVYRLHSIRASGAVAYDGPEPTPVQARVAAPVQRTQTVSYVASDTEYYGPTGISNGPSPQVEQTVTPSQPQNVTFAPKINHPYASEKHFAISMPSIGINDLTITHPQDAASKEGVLEVLGLGVGHLFSYPGGGGKIMVYGHSSGYPWDVSEFTKIFRRINELQDGDKVYVTYAGNLYIYQVTHEQTILAKNANEAFHDEGVGEELILFTCWPPDSIAQRYLVHAVPVETVALR